MARFTRPKAVDLYPDGPLVGLSRPSGEGPALEFRKPGLVSQSDLQALKLNSKPLQRHE